MNRYVIAFEEHLGGARQTSRYHALHEYALQQVGSVTEQHSILIPHILFENAVCIIQERKSIGTNGKADYRKRGNK